MHFLGLNGIPRRYRDFSDVYSYWNSVSTWGSILSIVSVVMFVYIVIEAIVVKRPVFAHSG